MPQPNTEKFSGVFISYRRDDSAGHAGRLFDRLSEHFGDRQIFMDIDHIEPGEDFVEVIEEGVGSCEVLITVIGRHWLLGADGDTRRLDDPNDFVRLEVAAALRRSIRVIPVLVQGAVMPKLQDLPDDLSLLARRQAIELSDQRWQHDIGRLINTLEKVLAEKKEARLKAAQKEEEERLRQTEAEELRRQEERLRQESEERSKLEEEEEKRKREAEAWRLVEELERKKRRDKEAEHQRRQAEEAHRKMREEAAAAERRKLAEAERLKREKDAAPAAAASLAAEEKKKREDEEKRERDAAELKQRKEEEAAARRDKECRAEERRAEERRASEARYRELNNAAGENPPVTALSGFATEPTPVYKDPRVLLILVASLLAIVVVASLMSSGPKDSPGFDNANEMASASTNSNISYNSNGTTGNMNRNYNSNTGNTNGGNMNGNMRSNMNNAVNSNFSGMSASSNANAANYNSPVVAKTRADFSTPRAAVETFIAASANRDVDLLSRCFDVNSAEEFSIFREKTVSREMLNDMATPARASEILSISPERDRDDVVTVNVKFGERNLRMVVRKSDAGWKIVDF